MSLYCVTAGTSQIVCLQALCFKDNFVKISLMSIYFLNGDFCFNFLHGFIFTAIQTTKVLMFSSEKALQFQL
jgi:hypothetical protein